MCGKSLANEIYYKVVRDFTDLECKFCLVLQNLMNTFCCSGYRCEVHGEDLHWSSEVWSVGMF